MGSRDPSLISDPGERKWVDEITQIVNHQLKINRVAPRVSLFQVPKTITTTKPEAYEPQQFGLGPIHHFQPQPYKMEQKKLAVMRNILRVDSTVIYSKLCHAHATPLIRVYPLGSQIMDTKLTHVLESVRTVVPVVRSCYDMFLQDGDEQLAWIFAIDGLFLLNLLRSYNHRRDGAIVVYEKNLHDKACELLQSDAIMDHEKKLHDKAGELMQPGTFFDYLTKNKSCWDTIELNRNEETTEREVSLVVDDRVVWVKLLSLPTFHPPLPEIGPEKRSVAKDIMMVENQIPFIVLQEIHKATHSSEVFSFDSTSDNRLAGSLFHIFCMVYSPFKLCSKPQAPSDTDHLLHYMYHSILNNVPIPEPDRNQGRSEILPTIDFVSNLPVDEIVHVYEQTISILETFCETNTIIPSASELHDKGGFLFHNLKDDQGIRDIGINGKDIYLPVITLNTESDVILRNLIAYETLAAASYSDRNGFPLAEYMVLMCALVVKADDVKRLEKVIKGDLSADEEVVKLFTGMSSSIPAMKKEDFKLKGMMDEINKGYYSMWRMKPYVVLKKLAGWLLVVFRAVGGFVGSTWKIVAFIVGLFTVFFLVKKAYCDAYGCK